MCVLEAAAAATAAASLSLPIRVPVSRLNRSRQVGAIHDACPRLFIQTQFLWLLTRSVYLPSNWINSGGGPLFIFDGRLFCICYLIPRKKEYDDGHFLGRLLTKNKTATRSVSAFALHPPLFHRCCILIRHLYASVQCYTSILDITYATCFY
jgi:hypothetical protein